MFEKIFRLSENQTTVKIELLAGLTTFLTMAYIIFLQPAILSGQYFNMPTGMDFKAVMAATCISAAIATAIMGLYARYPIALAPGMGENFFFVLTVLPAAATLAAVKSGQTTPWQVGLGVTFIAGVLFMLISLFGIRARIINAISPSMKNALAAGIGLFIAFIGLQNTNLVVKNPGTAVSLNPHFNSPDLIVFFIGLIVTAVLHARRVKGSILWGILAATLAAFGLRYGVPALLGHLPEAYTRSALVTSFKPALCLSGIIDTTPPSILPTLFKMDLRNALSEIMIPFIILFLFMDVFDTIGTLVGVSEQAGFIKDGKLPRAEKALLADATGTVIGACAGTSTVTCFIESAAGVEQGGRTGLTSVTVAVLFLLALFFSPLVAMVGSYPPITAAALVIVGAMMMRSVSRIDWADYTESIPAFLTLIGIPLSYSIADGLALGFLSYPIIKVFSGRGREVGWLTYVLALALLFYFIFIRARLAG